MDSNTKTKSGRGKDFGPSPQNLSVRTLYCEKSFSFINTRQFWKGNKYFNRWVDKFRVEVRISRINRHGLKPFPINIWFCFCLTDVIHFKFCKSVKLSIVTFIHFLLVTFQTIYLGFIHQIFFKKKSYMWPYNECTYGHCAVWINVIYRFPISPSSSHFPLPLI